MDHESEGDGNTVLDARDVYVLMRRGCRISRNIRASWYFQHLNSVIPFTPQEHVGESEEELSILSVVPPDGQPPLRPGQTYSVCITPQTIVTFLASRYRLAFTLDLSPSIMSVNICDGWVVNDELMLTLSNCLHGLVKPFQIPGSSIVFTPELFVTVVVHTPLVLSKTNQTLVQGMRVSVKNVEDFLAVVQRELDSFEYALCQTFYKSLDISQNKILEQYPETLEDDSEKLDLRKSDLISSPEAGFINMLRYGILALQLLPDNSSAGIIILTDGMVGLPDANILESLLTQLRNSTMACSFMKVGSCSLHQQLGHVPHTELMQFIATATFGAYFASFPDLQQCDSLEANVYHRALYFWNFQKGLEGFKYELTHQTIPDSFASIQKQLYAHPLEGRSAMADVLRKKHLEKNVLANIASVLSVRLREGYTIKDVAITKGGTQIEVKMVLPWRDYVRIEYSAVSSWPLDPKKQQTYVEICLEGEYEFLHEITCARQSAKNAYRTFNIRKFWHILQRLRETDQLLSHLQSFSTTSVYYTVPESIRNGVPLFYQAADQASTSPLLNTQLQAKDSALTQFASFWKPVILLDTNIWQKWMHTHRIGLVLEHDMPLPKYLHVPNASGRFNVIQCRQALTSLNIHLREWATFVLMENHSYIKLLFRDQDKPPSFFCVLRVTHKAPLMVLRLAFLGGTPSQVRNDVVSSLLKSIKDLRFPQRGTQDVDKRKKLPRQKPDAAKIHVKKPPLLRDWSDIHCGTILTKPAEKILIRYERQPVDMTILEDPIKDAPSFYLLAPMASSMKSAASMFNTLSCYLHHQRWIWTVRQNAVTPITLPAIGRVLMTLAKIRLQEGFHFALTKAGIVNMILEVDMKDLQVLEADESDASSNQPDSCLIQYIIFPPHNKTTRDSVSEEDMDEMETTEADGELQIVTECWVEPQYGVSVNNTPERTHFNLKTHQEIGKSFFPVDYECISSLVTFEHLIYQCRNCPILPSPVADSQSSQSCPPSPRFRKQYVRDDSRRLETSIFNIPFPFDLLALLPKSQQAELLFSTFIPPAKITYNAEDIPIDPKGSNNQLFAILFESLKGTGLLSKENVHDKEIPLTSEDCARFLKLLKSRKRDASKNPLPFNFVNNIHEATPTPEDKSTTDAKTSDPKSGKDSEKVDKESKVLGTPKLKDSKLGNFEINSPFTSSPLNKSYGAPIRPLEKQPSDEEAAYPMWRCFASAKTDTHMFLTFVPASFDDLLLLNSITDFGEDVAEEPGNRGKTAEQTVEQPDKVPGVTQPPSPSKPATDSDVEQDLRDVEDETSVDPGVEDEAHTVIPEEVEGGSDLQKGSSEVSGDVPNGAEVLEDEPSQPRPLLLPIYVYDCYQHNVVDSLVNRWDFTQYEDIYEDMSFDMADLDNTQSYGKMTASPRGRLLSCDNEDSVNEEESDIHRLNWRSSLDRRSNDSMCEGGSSAFRQHCVVISETYLTCFVTGVFKSLQQCFYVDQRDVNAAINNICEESCPLETDMTYFLQASCGHFQHIADKARKESGTTKEAVKQPRKLSVRFMDMVEDTDSDIDVLDARIPAVLQLPKVSTTLTIPLKGACPCDIIDGLRELVRSKFLGIVQKWFRPVPTHPDFYFYCSDSMLQDVSLEESQEDGDVSDSQHGDNADTSQTEHTDDEYIEIRPEEKLLRDGHLQEDSTSVLSSMGSSHSSESELDLDLTTEQKEEEEPLFIHFTCSMKNAGSSHFVSIRTLPQCLVDIWTKIEEEVSNLDLENMRFTFDINCMTLPSELDVPLIGKPSYIRMLSGTSVNPSSPHNESDQEDAAFSVISSDGFSKPLMGDPIGHLPKVQHGAVLKCKEEIEWLLSDEITSSLRNLQPISADALKYVTEHIKSSVQAGKPACVHDRVDLMFVYGADQSLGRFTEEFERMHLPGYHWTKEGDYYFVIIDRARAIQLRQHARDLKSALAELESGDIPPGWKDPTCRLFPAIEERSNSLPSVLHPVDQLTAKCVDSPEPITPEREDFRQRSFSDAKFMARPVGNDIDSDSVDVKLSKPTELTLPEMVSASHILDVPKIDRDPVESGEGSLKKSSSFAGFQAETQHEEIQQTTGGGLTTRPTLPHVRGRHFSAPSGQGTPHSRSSTLPHTPSLFSSRGSYTEDGYDGDSSDGDLDDTASTSDSVPSHPRLPKFWLILQISQDHTDIFFHTRETGHEEGEETVHYQSLLELVNKSINKICIKVNQQLLLEDLNDTHMCNNLLVPEADEDISWADKRTLSGRSAPDSSEVEEEEEGEDGKGNHYLFASLKLKPGYFACDCVWTKNFVLHPRLKTATGRANVSRGFLALRSVLNKFSVNNRRNMFVIRETESASRSVFYLRLKETRAPVNADDVSSPLEESFSRGMMASFKKESDYDMTEADTVSMTSGVSRMSSREEDLVQIQVYGIEEIGSEIREELMRLLQKKLDEAVLEVISVMLNRNPKCKLKPEDVHFIQRPDQEPVEVLQLTIPGHAMMYLQALIFYLRQNLLQFLHTPNYVDAVPEYHFQDSVEGQTGAIPQEDAFLHLRPQAIGGKGIACISLSLADGTGSPVKLLSCPKPCSMSSTKIQDPEEFERLVETFVHLPNPSPSRPGPTALIQFKIWENGNSDLKALRERLMNAVRYSLCDVVMEYTLLTAPICHIPRHLQDGFPLPLCSVPNSPTSPKDPPSETRDRRHSIISRRASDAVRMNTGLPAVPQSASPFMSLKGIVAKADPKVRMTSPPPDLGKSFDWVSVQSTTQPNTPSAGFGMGPDSSSLMADSGLKDLVTKYEDGERGSLNNVFTMLMDPWLAYCNKLGAPSVFRCHLNLLSRYSVDYVMYEVQSIIKDLSPTIVPRAFKIVRGRSTDAPLEGIPYHPCRHPVQPHSSLETSLDMNVSRQRSMDFILIGRDVEQWKTFVYDGSVMDQPPFTSTPVTKTYQTVQKFQPLLSADGAKSQELGRFTLTLENPFVPRQRLLIIFVKDRQLWVYTYNWAGDVTSHLEERINKLVKWNNDRSQVLGSIISQKLGLFHHNSFSDVTNTQDVSQLSDFDSLIKHQAPPQRDTQRRHSSMSARDRGISRMMSIFRPFDKTYKNLQPPRPLQNTTLMSLRDPVSVHGKQAQDIRSQCRRDTDRLGKLRQLYVGWLQKNVANPPVSEDYLLLLKQSSRLFHYCATPLLFHPQWRQRVVEKPMALVRQESTVTLSPPPEKPEGSKSRSRHSSGASVTSLRTKRSDSQDGRKKSVTPQDSPEVRPKPPDPSLDEAWHAELRRSFINQYKSYLKDLGFVVIKVQHAPSKKRYSKVVPPDGHATLLDDDRRSSTVFSLQKTFQSGIMMMEIGFRDAYFCVKMFVFDAQSLGTPVNQQMRLLFVDECEKCKDLIHVHSFAHDFHLRCIQTYLSGEACVFNHGFHLTSFLSDFIRIYPYPPSFSRNFLRQESAVLPDLPCPSPQLFDYMLKQMKQHEMRVFKMVPAVDADLDPEYIFVKADEFALVRHKKLKRDTKDVTGMEASDEYDVGLVIIHDNPRGLLQPEGELMVLKLKFFVVLTRRKDCFPLRSLDKKIGEFRSAATKTALGMFDTLATASDEASRPVAVKQHLSVRQEKVNYLGYSNVHQTPIYDLLVKEVQAGRDKIAEMVELSKVKCRRDYLWNRMKVMEEDSRRKKRSETEESRDLNLARLCFEEYLELLEMVTRTPLDEVDPQLTPFLNMPLQWYTLLFDVLINKYPDTHRSFISGDGQQRHILILNPNNLDMFMMASADYKANRGELCIVHLEPQLDQEHTPTNPNLPVFTTQSHIEDFVNACIFHTWTYMLQ
ncbi:KICSTOR complex protein SZT2-like [Haliotis cracherodii]|uniref:KICSTOR complex protein SZT2-like n=1 Tax=Haliotis cracherodii TaxID=6455 RepID=UPI0039EA17BC